MTGGRQNLVGWFESDDERYRWLNDVVCIAEGMIGTEGMEIHVYAGVHELPAGQVPANAGTPTAESSARFPKVVGHEQFHSSEIAEWIEKERLRR